MQKEILLIGAGNMATHYAKVLKSQQQKFQVIGRGEKSAQKFTEATDIAVITGGLENFLNKNQKNSFETAIVTVSDAEANTSLLQLIQAGFKRILVEKPAAFSSAVLNKTAAIAKQEGCEIYVAYNRRFYAPVQKAMEMIEADGGVTSFNFEFTEWSHRIGPSPDPAELKKNWLVANSSHVIDLAFFLGGFPKEMQCYTTGSLDWHPSGSIFSGAGISESGALFSYKANWESAGRWGVEALTNKRKYIFCPMEELQTQERGKIAVEKVGLDYSIDQDYKAGIFQQTKAFLENNNKDLLTLNQQAKHIELYEKMNSQ